MTVHETYYPGGYDPDHPSGNVAVSTVDHLDGTGTRTTYDETGTVLSTETVDMPIPQPAPVDPVYALGLALLARFPDIADAATTIASSNTAKPTLDLIIDGLAEAAATQEES